MRTPLARMAMVIRNGCGQKLVLAALVMVLAAVPMRAASASWSTLVSNGAPTNRVDIVFLGDGYTQSNLNAGLYTSHIENYLDYMFMFAAPSHLADPFPRYHKFFNVHKIDVVSNESGADNPIPAGIFRDTALDATYDALGIPRLLTINESRANNVLATNLAGSGIIADIRIVSVNADEYGGSGGSYAVFAGGNDQARDIGLHELSHSFSGTADEYVTQPGVFLGDEPSAVNVTKNAGGSKWSHWLGFQDPRGDYLDVGVFEGAADYSQGIYRPSLDSKMRTLERPFNAVVREKTILDIYAIVDPLDDWLDNGAPIAGSQLWVDVVDPNVISVDWYVNDQLLPSHHGEKFDLANFVFDAGTYSVRAHAYDEITNHTGDESLLDLVRAGLDALQQEVVWTVNFVPPLVGDYNLDRRVDADDYLVWKIAFGSNDELAADGNKNGVVDLADYAVWRDNFGSTSAAASVAQHAAPEPTAGLLACAAAIAVGAVIRRRG